MKLTNEEIAKRIKNFEVLKIPYDSGEMKLDQPVEEVDFRITSRLVNDSYRGLSFKHVNGEVFEAANRLVKDYNMNTGYGNDNKESFNLYFNFNTLGIKLNYNSTGKFEYSQVFQDVVKQIDAIPKELTCEVHIKRTTNKEYRKQCYYSRRNGKTPEEVFQRICGATTNGNHNSGRNYRNPFIGLIRRNIYSSYKESAVFLIEYLYGKKIPISSTFNQIFKVLSGLPYDTFGILDVQQILKLEKEFNYLHSPDSCFKKLYNDIELKPKTDLKRWVKLKRLQKAPEVIETR
jgi:hypothetical protein